MKKQGQELMEFGQLLSSTMSKQIKVQTHWATVTEVDWQAKTMTVKGTADDLEFYDVLLGLGSFYRKPKVGARCLIGMVMNQTAASFLIDCSEMEAFEITDSSGFKYHLNNGLMTLNGENHEGIVKAPELKTQIDKNTAILQALQNAISSWTPVSEDGGSAFKALLATVPSMQRADLSNIKNESIKHGS